MSVECAFAAMFSSRFTRPCPKLALFLMLFFGCQLAAEGPLSVEPPNEEHPAITRGKMIHCAPTCNEDVYKFIRIADGDRIVVVANDHTEPRRVDLSEMQHQFAGGKLHDLMTGDQENGRQVTVGQESSKRFASYFLGS